jgi:hypothetical protein
MDKPDYVVELLRLDPEDFPGHILASESKGWKFIERKPINPLKHDGANWAFLFERPAFNTLFK